MSLPTDDGPAVGALGTSEEAFAYLNRVDPERESSSTVFRQSPLLSGNHNENAQLDAPVSRLPPRDPDQDISPNGIEGPYGILNGSEDFHEPSQMAPNMTSQSNVTASISSGSTIEVERLCEINMQGITGS